MIVEDLRITAVDVNALKRKNVVMILSCFICVLLSGIGISLSIFLKIRAIFSPVYFFLYFSSIFIISLYFLVFLLRNIFKMRLASFENDSRILALMEILMILGVSFGISILFKYQRFIHFFQSIISISLAAFLFGNSAPTINKFDQYEE